MTSYYNRSEILSLWDLSEAEQIEAINEANDQQHAEERMYVRCGENVLPLDMFIRSEGKVWSGVYGITAFSAYFIKLNRAGDGAIVGYRYF